MAKNAGRLAGLAALAGAAYMLNKDKGEAPKGKEDTGPGYKSTETREEPRRQITDYMKKAPLDGTEMYRSGVMGGASQPAVSKPAPAAKPVLKPAVTADNATEDSQSSLTAPVTPAARSDQLANLSRAVKREDKTSKAAQSDFSNMTRSTRGDTPASIELKQLYDTLDKKAGAPTSSALKTDAMKVASRAAAAADRQRRIAREGAMKKGGAVKKMASGGSTASKRADGIASKGKTKCKMY
jgi:hypothetical protein